MAAKEVTRSDHAVSTTVLLFESPEEIPQVVSIVGELIAGNIDAIQAIVALRLINAPDWLIREIPNIQQRLGAWEVLGDA